MAKCRILWAGSRPRLPRTLNIRLPFLSQRGALVRQTKRLEALRVRVDVRIVHDGVRRRVDHGALGDPDPRGRRDPVGVDDHAIRGGHDEGVQSLGLAPTIGMFGNRLENRIRRKIIPTKARPANNTAGRSKTSESIMTALFTLLRVCSADSSQDAIPA